MAREEFLPASNVMKHFGQNALIWISILIIAYQKIWKMGGLGFWNMERSGGCEGLRIGVILVLGGEADLGSGWD